MRPQGTIACMPVSRRRSARRAIGPALAACAASALVLAVLPVPARETELARVLTLIGDADCTADDQCATVAVGARACGGPEAYLAWSRARSDETALREAAAATTRRAPKGKDAGPSTCVFVADPGAVCLPSEAPGSARRACRVRSGSPAAGSQVR